MLLAGGTCPAEADPEWTGIGPDTDSDSKERGLCFEGTRETWRVGLNGIHDRRAGAREAFHPPMGVTKATPSGGGFFTFELSVSG